MRETTTVSLMTRARLVQIMAALERNGATPIPSRSLHSFAFFANVLSPIWDLTPLDGSVLKQKSGPFYPALQREIDYLIGRSVLTVVSLKSMDHGEASFIEPSLRLSKANAQSVLEVVDALPDEQMTGRFLDQLAAAFVEITPDERADAATLDAAYSDPAVASGRIVDFAEWVEPTFGNPAWSTAQAFQQYMPNKMILNRAEKLAMYMRLIKKRAANG
jgi:hypothetical protein